MAIQWTTDLSTRIIEIDDQHKELFKQIDHLIEVWRQGKSRAEAESILTFLGDYMAFHFRGEESYMDKFGYSSAQSHKSQHAVFVKAFERLKDRYFQSGANAQLIADTNEQIVESFVKHIKYADKALGLFLKMKLPGSINSSPSRSTV